MRLLAQLARWVARRLGARPRASQLAQTLAVALLVAAMCTPEFAHALDPSAPLSHYGHHAWSVQEGELTSAPSALAQTKDGYVWIGTHVGVLRFDGVNFAALPTPASLANEDTISLLAARDGDLWIGTNAGVRQWHGTQLIPYGPRAQIDRLRQDAQGDIWFSRARTTDQLGPIGQISRGQVRYFGKTAGLDSPYGKEFALSPDKSLWLGTSGGAAHWDGHAAKSYLIDAASAARIPNGPDAVELAQDGSLWAGFVADAPQAGLQHLVDGKWIQVGLPDLGQSMPHVSELLMDRENVLWIGTMDRGLFRLRGDQIDHFTAKDGLSGDSVRSLLEDAEGNIWVGTTAGLDRFTDLHVASFTSRDGLIGDTVQSSAAAPDGSLWVSDMGALEQLRDGHVVKRLRVDEAAAGSQFNAAFVDRSGRLWAGVDEDLVVLDGEHFKRIRMPDGKPIGLIITIVQDTDGAIWALPVPRMKRVVRVANDQVVAELKPTDRFTSLLAATDGNVWLASSGETNSLERYKDGHLDNFAYQLPQVQGSTRLATLSNGPDGSVVGTAVSALVVRRAGTTRAMTAADGLPCDRVFATALDLDQTLWLYSACGVTQISAESFRIWWNHPGAKISSRTYDVVDGAQPGPTTFGAFGSVTSDGKVWFANGAQLQMVDPKSPRNNLIAPPVHVDEVIADHQHFSIGSAIRLGTNPANVEIDYTAASFVAPRKVLFRYRLDGRDDDWQDAGTRRQAFYTDLKPGHYTFRVIACNNDGRWNLQGDTVDIDVPPAFTQTRWFLALCLAGAMLAIWLIFRFRLRQERMRLDERVNERERIARELHDTLLQSAQGLIMVLQARLGRSALSDQDRGVLEKAAERANDLVREGRNRIQGLRAPPASAHELFADLKASSEAIESEGASFQAVLTGTDRAIEHDVKEEMQRIAAEAISNASRHSRARLITLRMEVGERTLTLSVKDDGVGMPQDALPSEGASDHWGITGMRERARRINARLSIVSAPNQGTELRLRVAGSRAFAARKPGSFLAKLLRWRRRDGVDPI